MDRALGSAPAIGGSWSKLQPALTPWILDVVHKMGFSNMTPVQAGTIPRAMKNQDCVVEAVTGSGKTLAFVVPVLERLVRNEKQYRKGEVAAIVIAPTRELAAQIHDVFHLFLSSLIPTPDPSSPEASSSRAPSPPPEAPYPLPMLITSGTPTPYETFASTGPSILIGTPGRLASFLLSPRGTSLVRVGDLDVLVLDEADRLLSSPDHRRDVERIMRHLPKQRRTHLFSATMTDAVEDMIGLGLRNPVRIVVNLKDKRQGQEPQERRTPTALQNTFLICRHAEKTVQLVRLLQREASNEAAKFIVYFSTCAAVDYFYRILSHLPALSAYHMTSLHGDLPPRVRETALSTFTSHPASHLSPAVLLCTDVASRGVDFADVDMVIQYDPPTDPKTFSHRAGRTARAGRKGKAVVLLGKGREVDYVDFLAARKIPLTPDHYLSSDLTPSDPPTTLDPAAPALLEDIRKLVLTDRELADKAAKAFVSSLHAYTKHEASFIFRVPDLDFHGLAMAYGLLRLPAMPEVRDWRKRVEAEKVKRDKAREECQDGQEMEEPEDVGWEEADVNWDTFAYASKSREAARLAAIEAKQTRPHEGQGNRDGVGAEKKRKIRAEMREAWSEQKDKKARREERRTKKDNKKQAEWERTQAEGGDKEVGLVEEWKKSVGMQEKKKKVVDEEMEAEYKSLKKEVKEEKAARKARAEEKAQGGLGGGMFDGLD
ncbi:ATP-dependent rRNA helicase spb4 [Saitozyma podzolica]|uniref:ATP-dependent RNA helicase n=1 Tax=Saitozyma podzolica TaxID=1890683 RepID=A0A427YU59_9TREE|nr:ATP-dependent rRNA helicase spb4 [Saitozyma podzolica]